MQTQTVKNNLRPVPKKPARKPARKLPHKPALKECVKCSEAKPLSEFYEQKEKSDGRRNICKTCYAVERRVLRRKQLNKEHRRALDYALELQRSLKRSPDSVTTQMVNRTIRSIRTRWAKNKRRAKSEILFAIEYKEARTLEEIADDVGLSKEATFDILVVLIRKGQIEEVYPPAKPNVQARRKFPLVYYVIKEKR